MNRAAFAVLALAGLSTSTCFAQLAPGDFVTASRNFGTVWRISDGTSTVLTGRDLFPANRPRRGTGLSLANSAQTSLLAISPTRLFVRRSGNQASALVRVDLLTGNRTVMPGTQDGLWSSGGELLWWSTDTLLSTADAFGSASADGRVLLYDLNSGTTTLASGGLVGDGFLMNVPRAVARINATEVLVVESGFDNAGVLVFRVDVVSGNRSVVSTLRGPVSRPLVTNGVRAENVVVPDRGTGPTVNSVVRSIIMIDARVVVATTINTDPGFEIGFIEVDLQTGNRSLLAGSALQNGLRITAPYADGSSVEKPAGPIGLTQTGPSTFALVGTFSPAYVWEFDVNTRLLRRIADLSPVINLVQGETGVELNALTLVPQACVLELCCDSIDYNSNGLFPEDADIVDFFNVSAGGACSTAACNDLDFNNDGIFPTDADLIAFLTVQAGGLCY